MKISTFAVGTLRAAIAWCLIASACGTAGRFLNARQTSVAARGQPHQWQAINVAAQTLAPAKKQFVKFGSRQLQTPVQAEAEAHVQAQITSLQKEADAAVAAESTAIAAELSLKTDAAKKKIEEEIPVAAAGDTADIAKDDAEAVAEIQEAMDKSTKAAEAAMGELEEKTEKAVKLSAQKAVGDVVKETETGAEFILKHSTQSEAEAKLLAEAANNATKFSKEASNNSALWVKELPTEDAAESVKNSLASLKLSADLRKSYEDVKRIAKLTGNLALDTIRKAQLAIDDAAEAKEDATLTMEQAGQNALLLNTIRKQTVEASKVSLSVVGKD